MKVSEDASSMEVEMEGDPQLASEIYGTIFLDDSTEVVQQSGLGAKLGAKLKGGK